MIISTESLQILNDITSGIVQLMNKLERKYPNSQRKSDDLCKFIKEELVKVEPNENQDKLGNIAKFLAYSSVLAHYQLFDNDKNFDKFLNLPEEERNKLGTDFKFGFKELVELVQCTVQTIGDGKETSSETESAVSANLLSNIREVSIKEYIESGCINSDIHLIALLGNKSHIKVEGTVMEYIQTETNYRSYIETALVVIKSVYTLFFQDSFGLQSYVGVLQRHGSHLACVDSNTCRLSSVKSTGGVFKTLADKVFGMLGVECSNERQFNIKAILNSSSPIYYPKKILEYAMGREITYDLAQEIYRPYSDAKTWESYWNGYIEPQITQLLYEAVFYSMERNLKFSSIKGLEGIKSFEDKLFKQLYELDEIKTSLNNLFSSTEFKLKVRSDLDQKVIRSLCAGVVVVKYNEIGGNVTYIKTRVANVIGGMHLDNTSTLYSHLTANTSTDYEAGLDITEGLKAGSEPFPFNIIDFAKDFNPEVTEKEPLFGYKAVLDYIDKGVALSWDKILLGEDLKGTPIFASKDDRIQLQTHTLHNIFAGSRSGKGVMTMNILVSAVASNKPIYYIDRKPDMASMFFEIIGENPLNMFLVNGGDIQDGADPSRYFAESGKAIEGWKTAYNNLPDWLLEMTDVFNGSYAGFYGDMVYLRAILLVIGIIVARAKNKELRDMLGGDAGVIVIIDEITNWMNEFESKYFSSKGVLASYIEDMSKYNKAESDFEEATLMLDAEGLDDKDHSKYVKQRIKSQALLQAGKQNKSYLRTAYIRDLFQKYAESLLELGAKLNAGFNDEKFFTDIFLIGQDLEREDYLVTSTMYPINKTDGKFGVAGFSDSKHSPLRGALNKIGQKDWFFGYNAPHTEYVGADGNTSTSKYITGKRMFCYVPDSNMDTVKTTEPSKKYFFKPYLVLNKNCEDDPNGEEAGKGKYTYVSQCRNRVNEGGKDLWSEIRLKHLQNQDINNLSEEDKKYGNLHEGVGFRGLVNLVKQSSGVSNFSPTDLKSSADFANLVATSMGYTDYRSLLFDLSPAGLFSVKDVVAALENPQKYQSDIKGRFPNMYKFGIFDSGTASGEAELGESVSDYNPDMFTSGFDMEGYEEPEDKLDAFVSGIQGGSTSSREGYSNLSKSQQVLRSMYEEEDDDKFTKEELRSLLLGIFKDLEIKHDVTISMDKKNSFILKAIKLFDERGFIK